MKNKEGVNRKKEYYDGLKDVVSEPLHEDYKASIETFMGLESVSSEAKEIMLFSTEVVQPFTNALEWVKDRDSSYALSADSNFKLRMSEFYPDTCPF